MDPRATRTYLHDEHHVEVLRAQQNPLKVNVLHGVEGQDKRLRGDGLEGWTPPWTPAPTPTQRTGSVVKDTRQPVQGMRNTVDLSGTPKKPRSRDGISNPAAGNGARLRATTAVICGMHEQTSGHGPIQ